MKRTIIGFIFSASCLLLSAQVRQDAFNGTRGKVEGGNKSAFNQNRANKFNDYRQKLNAEYVSKTREKWKSFNSYRGVVPPDKDVNPVTPIQMSDEDAQRNKQDKLLNIESIISPIHNNSSPQPIAPVQEVPENSQETAKWQFFIAWHERKCNSGCMEQTMRTAIQQPDYRLCETTFHPQIVRLGIPNDA